MSGSGGEVYNVTFPAGQIGIPIEFPLTDSVMLGDTISFNITIDQSYLPPRVTISDPDETLLTVWFSQRKLTVTCTAVCASQYSHIH